MKRRILIVDDERQMRQLVSLFLTRKGYEVFTATTSSEALQVLVEKKVHLVVLDISLANEDGFALLERIKREHPQVGVVMLTGMGFVEDLLLEAHALGADGYVSKVLPLEELQMTIERVIGTNSEGMAACSE